MYMFKIFDLRIFLTYLATIFENPCEKNKDKYNLKRKEKKRIEVSMRELYRPKSTADNFEIGLTISHTTGGMA
jgi:hypothetical protein